ncbi:hypothetical protein B0H63DRAFT_391239 [Podospora didyma]|uniref:DUF7082 domain-containing protein n=1 Tax=Podospora didyma TaxID=330526 RepID=A0AAE0NXW7_9PEZI|nr:hypothetical protein B0H63DRAFT_391239 [Podospora didyma]
MSGAKFEEPVYKVYEPGYRTRRTIIVDEEIESPETLTIHLEEEAERNGGDLTGDAPTSLLSMSAFKAQAPQLHGYADSAYSQYAAQPYSTQQTENAASQINQLAFAANTAATGHYLAAQHASSANVNVLSCHPNVGAYGTKVSLKVTSHYDLVSGTMPTPYVSVMFGSQRCQAQVMRSSLDGTGTCTYTVTAEAPQFLSTSCPSLSNVPLTLLIEGNNGEELGRASNVGTFSYHHAAGAGGGVGMGGAGDTSTPDLESPKTRSPAHQHQASPPNTSVALHGRIDTTNPTSHHGIASNPATSTYGFPPSVSAATAAAQAHAHAQAAQVQSEFAYSQGHNMLSAYRTTASYPDHYPRAPPILRSPLGATGWTPFPNHPSTSIAHATSSVMTRSGVAYQHPNPAAPQLFRTKPNAGGSSSGGYSPYGVQSLKAELKICGDLDTMTKNWTQEEWESKRRLVLFKKSQSGSVVTINFRHVSPAERPPHSMCISCIWWEEKKECYVTSVDTIALLEHLLVAPNKFCVEEKNRIRRNLEGFQPSTVSKSKIESEEFFKLIMTFPAPKPRNIEKDVKVFSWNKLSLALRKIISKYSTSPAGIATPSGSPHLVTSASVSSPMAYQTLPPTPLSASSTAAGDSATLAGYGSAATHHHNESVSSPRPLSGGSAWQPYASSSSRTMSPAPKGTNSPIPSSGLRLSTLPAVYDSRGTAQSLVSPYSMSSPAHHSPHHGHGSYGQTGGVPVSQSQTRSWDAYPVSTESFPSQTSHAHNQVYSGGAYGDGVQRA